jgi:hypothetical protein
MGRSLRKVTRRRMKYFWSRSVEVVRLHLCRRYLCAISLDRGPPTSIFSEEMFPRAAPEKADISATSRGSQKKGLVHLPAPECSVYRRYKVRG